MTNLDNRISKLEQVRHDNPVGDVTKMSDEQLLALIRRDSPDLAHLDDEQLIAHVTGNILQQVDELGVHPCTVDNETWQQMKDDL